MNLFFREYGHGKPLIILHGLFGMSDNWVSLGRQLADNYHVYIPDLRNHGQSPHDPHHSYPAMVEDVIELIRVQQIHKPVLIGHSMGGKVAMLLASENPQLPDKLIVIDISPKPYDLRHQHLETLNAMINLDVSTLTSRRDVEELVFSSIADPGLRQVILKNLDRTTRGTFVWKPNLKAIHDNLDLIAGTDQLPVSFTAPALFIRGGRSDYVDMDDLLKIKQLFPGAVFRTISQAGHWVHADAPDELLLVLREFLR